MGATTIEWCAHCEYEVEIPMGEVSTCPKCGASIRQCNECLGLPDSCDWRDDGYCHMFPDFRYTEDNKEEKKCKVE